MGLQGASHGETSLMIPPATQKMASSRGCDAVVHSVFVLSSALPVDRAQPQDLVDQSFDGYYLYQYGGDYGFGISDSTATWPAEVREKVGSFLQDSCFTDSHASATRIRRKQDAKPLRYPSSQSGKAQSR